MPTLPLPLGRGVEKRSDESALAEQDSDLFDGFIDLVGASVKRPGATQWQDLTGGGNAEPGNVGIDGIYFWEQREALVVVANGLITVITRSLGSYSASDLANTTAPLTPGVRPTFSCDGSNLVIASGGRMVHMNGVGSAIFISDADAPTAVTHVTFLDGFHIANSVGTNRWYFSENVNDPSSWNGLDFASGAANPDYITAIHVLRQNLYLFGTSTIEVWQNDGSTPFSRLDGGVLGLGTLSPYSIARTKDEFYLLDENRRFQRIVGADAQELECPYTADIEAFDGVTDCFVDRIHIGGYEHFVWTFPQGNKSYAFCRTTKSWSIWGDYQDDGSYDQWLYKSYCYAKPWNLHVVGRHNSPFLDLLSTSATTDGDSSTIRPCHRTGHVDHGSLRDKLCNRLQLRVKTGAAGASSPYLQVRWRDNDRPTWSNERRIPLRSQGDTNLVGQLNKLGRFRSRQWEFSCSASVPVSFLRGEVDIDFLGA
jgi:hypothetical protein